MGRFSQAISEGDGISVIPVLEHGDVRALAAAADASGAEAIAVRSVAERSRMVLDPYAPGARDRKEERRRGDLRSGQRVERTAIAALTCLVCSLGRIGGGCRRSFDLTALARVVLLCRRLRSTHLGSTQWQRRRGARDARGRAGERCARAVGSWTG